jgi:hypothetical protein
MLVREKIGFYAGQVRDFPEHIAHELIANGRGVNPFHEIEDAPGERTTQPPAVNQTAQPKALRHVTTAARRAARSARPS